jgi:hypothetical protein
MKLLTSVVYAASEADPWIFVSAYVAVMALVAIIASWPAGRRALSIDP